MLSRRIRAAWREAEKAYETGGINSECTLQAVMYAELVRTTKPMCVFCEPRLELGEAGTVVPDLVILDGESIAAVLELKFKPEGYPVFESDLGKFRELARSKISFPITLDPKSGRYSTQRYCVAEDCLFVFAVIGRHDAVATCEADLARHASIGERFIPLTFKVGG